MKEYPKLAERQQKGVFGTIDLLKDKKGYRHLLVAPTGAGKTVMFGYITALYAKQSKYVFILTDRTKLLTQTGNSIVKFFNLIVSYVHAGNKGLPATMTLEGDPIYTIVAMVDTLKNRLNNRFFQAFIKKLDVTVIVDEAHEARFRKIINHELFSNANIIGVTATPKYASKKVKMRDDYNSIEVLATEKELIDEGLLLQPITYSYKSSTLNKKKNNNGDYYDDDQISYQRQFMPLSRMVDIYEKHCNDFFDNIKENNPYIFAKEYAFEKHIKAIYFAVNSSHAIEIAEAFNKRGIPAKYILSNTKLQSESERKLTEKEFSENKFKILVNCQITTKGYDDPDVIIIGKMYLTTSITKDVQVGGRGARVLSELGIHALESIEERKKRIAQSKKPYFIIIDYLGNHAEKSINGTWDVEKDWEEIFHSNEKYNKKEGDVPLKECPKCGTMIHASKSVCDKVVINPETHELGVCGHIFEKKQKKEIEEDFVIVNDTLPIGQMTVAQLSDAYSSKSISYEECIKAVKAKGEFLLIEFAKLQGYKKVDKWIKKKFQKTNAQYLELCHKHKIYSSKKQIWLSMLDRYQSEPGKIDRYVKAINDRINKGERWSDTEKIIKATILK